MSELPIWRRLLDRAESVPLEEQAVLPPDAAALHDVGACLVEIQRLRAEVERLEAENAALRHTLEQCKAMGALLVEVVAGTAKAALARELLATFHVEAAAPERDG